MRRRGAARTEQDPQRPAIVGADHTGREPLDGRRPARLAVEEHLVRRGRPGRQALDDHQGVVVVGHGERAGPVPEHLDRARRVGLDPDRRRRVADVSEHRPEDQVGHRRDGTLRSRAAPSRRFDPPSAPRGHGRRPVEGLLHRGARLRRRHRRAAASRRRALRRPRGLAPGRGDPDPSGDVRRPAARRRRPRDCRRPLRPVPGGARPHQLQRPLPSRPRRGGPAAGRARDRARPDPRARAARDLVPGVLRSRRHRPRAHRAVGR